MDSKARTVGVLVAFLGVCPFGAGVALAQTPAGRDTCVSCHAGLPESRLARPAELFAQPDIHRESGFACADCHRGDPGATEKSRAHDGAHGFRGKPMGLAVITACARCHSDAELMRRFAPRQRVDQALEYATSVHGKRLAAGDTKVATCASCHGAHGVRRVKDSKSPVFPTNVGGTCASCHASDEHMRGYTLPGGAPLPVNQFSEYQKSVHYAALMKADDLSAPSCNACHGNHGAAPPGVGSVANVCGTCHAVFAQKFETSVHAQIFDKGCVECHGNHAVLKPSDEMLGTGAHAICATCHGGPDDKGAVAAEAMRGDIDRLKGAIDATGTLVARVKNAGIEVSTQELALAEARSHLTLARAEIHASDAARVDAIIQDGLKIVTTTDTAGQRGLRELKYRRTGLVISLGVILLVVVTLASKIRQLDRRG